MVKFKRATEFFNDEKRIQHQKSSSKKMQRVLKMVGGKKGLLLSSILLNDPKYKL